MTTVELAQAQKVQKKLSEKETLQLNGEITQQLMKRCGLTIHTSETPFTNNWYRDVIDQLRKFYEKHLKKATFRSKSDYVHYLSQFASEEENVLWKKGLPSSQSSSQSTFTVEEPFSQ